jgi:ketosteroid isomerase-like protein
MRTLAFIAILFMSACASVPGMLRPTVEVERELMNVDRAFSDMSAKQGMAAAFTYYMDPQEGAMIRPGSISEGTETITRDFTDIPREIGLTWIPDRAYASNSGDFGVTTGRFTRTAAGRQTAVGRYVTVWRMNSAGQWKALMEIGNTDPVVQSYDAPVYQPANPP